MPKGTVKWFNSKKGYGPIQRQEGGKDVFVRILAIEQAGGRSSNLKKSRAKGKTSAENLKVQDGLWSGSRQPITAASIRLPVSILFHTPSSHLHRNGRR
jgi:cold shock CspA family protein